MKTETADPVHETLSTPTCQKHVLKQLREPEGKIIPPPLSFRFRRSITSRLSQRQKIMLKKNLDRLCLSPKATRPAERSPSEGPRYGAEVFHPGDPVRVRSQNEIEETLNVLGQLKGCSFMEEMRPFCGTTQKVLKPVNRFIDERDHKLKKCKGIVLLENALCQGTHKLGPCDRSCFFFWRVEWLEKI